MLHEAIRSLNISHSNAAAKQKNLANGSLSLLDLQGLQPEVHHKTDIFGDNSAVSLLLCL